MPAALVDKINKAETFNRAFCGRGNTGFGDRRYEACIWSRTASSIRRRSRRTTLADLKMPSEIVMRHRIPQFGHIFSGEGYAAGYYGYLWAETLDHDAFEAFTEAGSPWDPGDGEALPRRHLVRSATRSTRRSPTVHLPRPRRHHRCDFALRRISGGGQEVRHDPPSFQQSEEDGFYTLSRPRSAPRAHPNGARCRS